MTFTFCYNTVFLLLCTFSINVWVLGWLMFFHLQNTYWFPARWVFLTLAGGLVFKYARTVGVYTNSIMKRFLFFSRNKPPDCRRAVRTYTGTIQQSSRETESHMTHQGTVHRVFLALTGRTHCHPCISPCNLHTIRPTYVWVYPIPAHLRTSSTPFYPCGTHQFSQYVQTTSKLALFVSSSLSIVAFPHCSASLHS